MRKLLRNSCLGTLSLLLASALVWAQATAQLDGRVTDESEAVLPGVTVMVTQTNTGLTRTVVNRTGFVGGLIP